MREGKGKKQEEVADLMGIHYTAYNRYENGKTQNISRALEKKLLLAFSPDEVEYIKYGNKPYPTQIESSEQDHLTCVHESPAPYQVKDTISIPYYPEIYASAGGGAVVYDSLTGTEPMRLSRAFVEDFLCVPFSKHIHVINVKGDSMAPTIIDGELIFVSPLNGNGIVDGHIYVIMYEDDIYVKRIRKVPFSKRFKLISDNEDVGDVELTEKQTAACTVVGEVVGQMRRNG
jgi:phage repressor protein C with HTH and peptisase S24 domain